MKAIKRLDQAKEEANALFKAGKYEDAIVAFTTCLEIDPMNYNYNATIYLNRAIAYSKLKKNELALGDLNKCIAAKEDYAKAYVKRGEVHLALEYYEEAVRDFEKAKTLVSSPHEFNLGELLKHAKLELKKSKRKDYYKILGIPKDTSDENAIKKAYRKAALKWHPDKWGNATDEEKKHADKMFKDLGEAYAVLSDPKKKQRYD